MNMSLTDRMFFSLWKVLLHKARNFRLIFRQIKIFSKNINLYQLFLILKHLNNRKQSKKYF